MIKKKFTRSPEGLETSYGPESSNESPESPARYLEHSLLHVKVHLPTATLEIARTTSYDD